MTSNPEKTALFRPLDLLVGLAILAGAALALPYLSAPFGSRAEVYLGSERVARLSLAGPVKQMDIATGLGPMRLEYGEGWVRVAQAPCPNKLCVRQGRASRAGMSLICLPCRVRVEVDGGGGKQGGYDAVTF
jgi:hypothetical protein